MPQAPPHDRETELLRAGDLLDPQAELDITAKLLDEVARGTRGRTIRLAVPAPTVAFGRLDAQRAGFEAARSAATAQGFTPVLRTAGGHAVAYDAGSVVIQVFNPEPRWPAPIEARYTELVDLTAAALTSLGVPIEVGELPDEYCAGRFSLHLPGGPKVAGLAQRVLRRASLSAGVVVVDCSEALTQTISEVYAALGLPLDPTTVGGISDRHPAVSLEMVLRALSDASLKWSR